MNRIILVILSLLISLSAPAVRASDQETIALLKAQIEALSARLEKVEDQSEAQLRNKPIASQDYAAPTTAQPVVTAKPNWSDAIKLKGDFRYRHEAFDVDNNRDHHRQRVRARTALQAKVSDTVQVGFGLATGGSDPISTNQTLGDGSSSKGVVIDLAYVNWQSPVEGVAITAGKFKNPLHRVGGNGLIWDGDLNPEGFAVSVERGNFFASALGSWLDESSRDDDSFLLGGQIGIDQKIGSDSKVKLGLGYYNFLDSRGEPAFFNGNARGNQVDANGNYINGFELVEAFVEYTIPVGGGKLTLFGDFVQNLDADDFDTGFAVGAKLKKEAWQFGYTYQELEADAVLGTFTDSDFVGGGTDGEGHILQAGYALTNKISLRGTLFLNERNIDFGVEEDFTRLMLDIGFKY